MPKQTEITMKRYADWRPTAHDTAGKSLPERQDWLVTPFMITRDTEDCLTLSNWHVLTRELAKIDPDGVDHETHRFGHWGPGWFEIVIVRPDTATAIEAQQLADACESYPILDDSDFSEREMNAETEAWQALSVKDRVDLLKRAHYRGCVLVARREYAPADDNGAIRERLLNY